MLALVAASSACAGGDLPGLTTLGFSDTDVGTTTNDSATGISTIDPETGVATSSVTADSTAGPADTTTSSDSTGPVPPVCGDGFADEGEDCDGDDLAGSGCADVGFVGGRLACNADCTFDTTSCETRLCGNGVIEGSEDCEGTDLGGETCVTQGFPLGTLACTAGCAFDTSGCFNPSCGNGVIEGMELCDGASLGGATCGTQGFFGGTLGCTLGCAFDTSGCTNCGNGAIDGAEVCDGGALAGQSCVTQGFDGGVLGCAGSCAAFDAAGCTNFGGDCCAANGTPGCDDAGCTTAVCGLDPFCCNNQWDGQCANEAIANAACQGVGGSCPGGGGFPCADEDIGSSTGAAVTSGNTAGDDNDLNGSCGGAGGNDRVITFTAPIAGDYTFDTFGSGYDTKLSLFSDCATEISCNDDTAGLQSQLVLNMAAGQQILVVVDGFNGSTGAWVLNITQPVPVFACSDQNIGSAVGAGVASGNTGGDDNDLNPNCGGASGNDHVMTFIAPAAATYTFDTFGSGYDTKLALFSDCATQLSCNDDTAGLQSQLVLAMAAGQPVLVSVDGFNGSTGAWVLNITQM